MWRPCVTGVGSYGRPASARPSAVLPTPARPSRTTLAMVQWSTAPLSISRHPSLVDGHAAYRRAAELVDGPGEGAAFLRTTIGASSSPGIRDADGGRSCRRAELRFRDEVSCQVAPWWGELDTAAQ